MDRQAIVCCMVISAHGRRVAHGLELVDLVGARPVDGRSSFASAPGAKAHRAEAQLPAYWRIDGRNDTRSGRRLPEDREEHAAPATIAAVSHGDDMSPTP